MKNSIRFILLTAFSIFVQQASAFVSPLGFGIVNPVQFPPDNYSVAGLRASVLWGDNRDIYGIDLGVLGNITQQSFVGTAISGVFNMTHGMTTIVGVQAAGITNWNTQKTNVYGLQIAAGINSNEAESSVTGLQLAVIANLAAHTNVYGAQIGIYNRAKEVYGFQIGLVNVCDSLHGLQIGLMNFHHTGLFVVSPILNVGF